jgi:hypothetical protein
VVHERLRRHAAGAVQPLDHLVQQKLDEAFVAVLHGLALLAAALEELAKEDERSLSAYINRVLRQHIEAVRKKPKGKG